VKALILDSEAVSQLARAVTSQNRPSSRLRSALEAAAVARAEVLVPAAVLAEQYRGGPYDQTTDSFLARHPHIQIVVTDRDLARKVGNLLARKNLGSTHHVDAAVVAVAAEARIAVIFTGDPDDIRPLAADYPGIRVEPI
jgi:hypothetical protein